MSRALTGLRHRAGFAVLFGLWLSGCANLTTGEPPRTGAEGSIAFDARLWRAARQVVGFLPPGRADPAGGVIETGWGAPKGGGGLEEFQVTVELDYTQAYANAIAVIVRKRSRVDGEWREAEPDGIAAVQLARLIARAAGNGLPSS